MKKILLLLTVFFITTLFGSIGSISTIKTEVKIQKQNSLIQAQINSKNLSENVGGTGAGTISSGLVYGHAYDSNGTIKSVGGNFKLSTDSNQAIGSFIGTRQ